VKYLVHLGRIFQQKNFSRQLANIMPNKLNIDFVEKGSQIVEQIEKQSKLIVVFFNFKVNSLH